MLKGKAYFHRYKSKGVLTIQSGVWQDSAWPFENSETLEAEIKNGVVIIQKPKKQEQKRLTDEE